MKKTIIIDNNKLIAEENHDGFVILKNPKTGQAYLKMTQFEYNLFVNINK